MLLGNKSKINLIAEKPFKTIVNRSSLRMIKTTLLWNDPVKAPVKIGQKIAITGKTGSGKSTLIDLIIGLLKPESGEIIIDGNNISNISFSSWVKNLSHVPQVIFLKNDTIYNNISFMNDNFSE